MPIEGPRVGQCAQIIGCPGISVGVELFRSPGRELELLLWLSPSEIRSAVEFWTEWYIGQPVWIKFKRECVVLNRAVFAAVEVHPVHGPVQPPPDAWWLPLKPRRLQTGAKS